MIRSSALAVCPGWSVTRASAAAVERAGRRAHLGHRRPPGERHPRVAVHCARDVRDVGERDDLVQRARGALGHPRVRPQVPAGARLQPAALGGGGRGTGRGSARRGGAVVAAGAVVAGAVAAGVVAAGVVAAGADTLPVELAEQPVASAATASADPARTTRLTPTDELFNRAPQRT